MQKELRAISKKLAVCAGRLNLQLTQPSINRGLLQEISTTVWEASQTLKELIAKVETKANVE